MLNGRAADWADLVRLPSVLTVPGDVLLGSFATGSVRPLRLTAARTAGSCCVYSAGMALNDYADRAVDARERPSRPIPSGRVAPGEALAVAGALFAAGLVASGAGGGWRSLRVCGAMAAVAAAYDLWAKDTRLGPAALACARFLDVMHGAGAVGARRALAPAAVMAAHTLGVGVVSRREVEGAGAGLPAAALAGTAAVAAGAARVARAAIGRRPVGAGRAGGRIAATVALGAFAGNLTRAQAAAVRSPGPAELQRVVGAGVLGMVPLQAGMLAGLAPPPVPAGLAGAWLAARRLAARRPVT
ncbi:MAG: SCO3242 family prenyltransferase [Thermoleophilia bacterium]